MEVRLVKEFCLCMDQHHLEKSNINFVKKGLEEYTKTDEGAVYGLVDSLCRKILRAIPEELREQVEEELGIRIDGQLSPPMSYILEENMMETFRTTSKKNLF